jgi:hypothetical protein
VPLVYLACMAVCKRTSNTSVYIYNIKIVIIIKVIMLKHTVVYCIYNSVIAFKLIVTNMKNARNASN